MTQREQRLAIIVGGGLAVLAAWQVVKWTAIDPIKATREKIDAAVERRVSLEQEAAKLATEMRGWQERTAHTLHAKPEDARRLFRQEIDRLAQEHGLTDGLRLSDGVPQQLNSEGFVALPVSIRCSGNKKSVVDFLIAFYRLPYLGRITSVNLTAEETFAPRGRGRDAGPPPEPRLSVSINAAALVLPSLKYVKGERHGEYAAVASVQRLRREAEYVKLLERNIFSKWAPKPEIKVAPPDVRTEPDKPTDTNRGGRPRTALVVDRRAGVEKLKLAICESLHGVPYALVYDERKQEEPPVEYRLNAEIDDGTLVMIQARGMVVRVQEETDGASSTAYYFYELGKSFKERTAITPESFPDLAAELNLVSAQ